MLYTQEAKVITKHNVCDETFSVLQQHPDNHIALQNFFDSCKKTIKSCHAERKNFIANKRTGPNYNTKIINILDLMQHSQITCTGKTKNKLARKFAKLSYLIKDSYKSYEANLTTFEQKIYTRAKALTLYFILQNDAMITGMRQNTLYLKYCIGLLDEKVEE